MNDLHLDSPNFDTKKYFSTFLKSSTIKELIKKNNEIEEEIKIHDHQIQSLVFENYSKFIASIDTVTKMKNDISQVDNKLKNLDQSMDKIAQLAERIDGTFSVKRKQIQKLDTINKDLKKLKTLCQFPDVLKSDLQFYKSLEKNDGKNVYKQLFNGTVQCYKDCFTTLTDFKSEALIAPIYKESINKVQQVRSILCNLQNQLKARQSSEQLKNITLKLITVNQEQVSPLRTYFKKIKQKYNENCLTNQKYFVSLENQFSEKEQSSEYLRAQYQTKIQKSTEDGKIFLNDQFWKQFEMDFKFIFQQVYPIIRSPEQVNQIIIMSCRDAIFSPILQNFCQSVLKSCHSAVHFNLVMESALKYFYSLINSITIESLKKQLSALLISKLQILCSNKIILFFISLKKKLIEFLIKQKSLTSEINNSEDLQKDIYAHLTSVKNYIQGNFIRLTMDLSTINHKQHFSSFKNFFDIVSTQTKQFIKFVVTLFSTPSHHIGEQIIVVITSHLPKTVITSTVKRQVEEIILKYKQITQNGNTYLFVHNLLNIFEKSLVPKLLEDFYNSLRLSEDQKYLSNKQLLGNLTDHAKKGIYKNLSNFCLQYILEIDKIYQKSETQDDLQFNLSSNKIQQFLHVCGFIFPESRKTVPKKPSFLNTSQKSLRFDMDIMVAKKIRIFQKKDYMTRSSLLSSFLRGILKTILKLIRKKKFICKKFEAQIYCAVQLCYQISSVDDQSLVNAFYYLIRQQYYRGVEVPKIDKGTLDGIFSNQRSKLNI